MTRGKLVQPRGELEKKRDEVPLIQEFVELSGKRLD
jgi:hypothetical protein